MTSLLVEGANGGKPWLVLHVQLLEEALRGVEPGVDAGADRG